MSFRNPIYLIIRTQSTMHQKPTYELVSATPAGMPSHYKRKSQYHAYNTVQVTHHTPNTSEEYNIEIESEKALFTNLSIESWHNEREEAEEKLEEITKEVVEREKQHEKEREKGGMKPRIVKPDWKYDNEHVLVGVLFRVRDEQGSYVWYDVLEVDVRALASDHTGLVKE